jgi:glycosyltransferase involved in cell wall biosynthesis
LLCQKTLYTKKEILMKKPVLSIFYQYDPWNSTIGGIQTTINSFIKHAPDDFDIRVVGITANSSTPIGTWSKLPFEGRSVDFLPLFHLDNDNIRHFVPTTLRYALALSRHHFKSDFFHFHRIEPALAATRWQGHKILFIHNDIRQQMTNSKKGKTILWRYFPLAYFALEKKAIGQFDKILSCNSEATRLYQDKYPNLADRVSTIHNTVDEDRFYPWKPEQQSLEHQRVTHKHQLPANKRFILFAGRLHPQKDPILLIQSFAELRDDKLHLLIAGDGELLKDIKSEIHRLNLENQVTLLGAVQQADLADLHRLADVFVLTSEYEGLPLAVLEALACGTPVVTTRCGETPRLLSPQSGVVSQERTPQSIASALKQVLAHPKRYPQKQCLLSSYPYNAKKVIQQVYTEMQNCYEQENYPVLTP